jgi:hypothetical protein
MAALGAKMERLSSIDAQLRMLVPGKVSEDDKLIEYDALLLDRFLDILQDLHGDDLKEMVTLLRLVLRLLLFFCFTGSGLRCSFNLGLDPSNLVQSCGLYLLFLPLFNLPCFFYLLSSFS